MGDCKGAELVRLRRETNASAALGAPSSVITKVVCLHCCDQHLPSQSNSSPSQESVWLYVESATLTACSRNSRFCYVSLQCFRASAFMYTSHEIGLESCLGPSVCRSLPQSTIHRSCNLPFRLLIPTALSVCIARPSSLCSLSSGAISRPSFPNSDTAYCSSFVSPTGFFKYWCCLVRHADVCLFSHSYLHTQRYTKN